MPVSDLLLEGVNLMLLGMGMVFVFLTLLVLAMNLMSRLARSVDSGTEIATPTTPAAIATPGAGEDDLVAVIAAAIARYRADHH